MANKVKYETSNHEILSEVEYKNDEGYPTNRVIITSYDYKFTNEKGDVYEGKKVEIVNSKLVLNKQKVEIKKKVINGRSYDDETKVSMSPEHFNDLKETMIGL